MCAVMPLVLGLLLGECLFPQIVLVLVQEKVLSVPAEMPLRRAAVS
jgi:hypothetical protein